MWSRRHNIMYQQWDKHVSCETGVSLHFPSPTRQVVFLIISRGHFPRAGEYNALVPTAKP